jgi:hypothetical protein
MVRNNENELVPTHIQTVVGVYFFYLKLNSTTRKSYFSLPFID